MCHCWYHSTPHANSMKKTTHPPKTARKTRSKIRRPKFLSLQRQLSTENRPPMPPNTPENELHLFPLHPESLFGRFSREPEDKEIDENVAWFLDPEGSLSEGGNTINGLLGTSDEDLEPSMVYDYMGSDGSRSDVAVAGALRHKARGGEEKWVVYSDVAAMVADGCEDVKSKAEEEVSSVRFAFAQTTKLLLKLDYEDILNAWSDKGPLYIEGECPQTVPDQNDRTNLFMDLGCARNVKLWSVPEDGCSAIEDGGEGKMGQRKARVMRYKEKRQSRLFSKRVRYEVRKLNAEKRPRMKGRFVKRMADV